MMTMCSANQKNPWTLRNVKSRWMQELVVSLRDCAIVAIESSKTSHGRSISSRVIARLLGIVQRKAQINSNRVSMYNSQRTLN